MLSQEITDNNGNEDILVVIIKVGNKVKCDIRKLTGVLQTCI